MVEISETQIKNLTSKLSFEQLTALVIRFCIQSEIAIQTELGNDGITTDDLIDAVDAVSTEMYNAITPELVKQTIERHYSKR